MAEDTRVMELTDKSRQYEIGAGLLSEERGPIFLMQRSSTLIMGWKEGSKTEEVFYKALMQRISKTDFYHVVSLDGIRDHLEVATKEKKQFKYKEARAHLRQDEDGNIWVQGEKGTRAHRLRRFEPAEGKQGRILLVGPHAPGAADAIIVFDVADTEYSVHLRGPKLNEYLEYCEAFCGRLGILTVSELQEELPELGDWQTLPLLPAKQSKRHPEEEA
jgi:hypothetical protein